MTQNITYYYKKADALATLKPGHFLFSEDIGTKGAKRFLVTTRENMYALINSKEESSYYENIEENDEVKLHFDIDIKVQNAKHNDNFLKDQVNFCIEEYNKILYDTFKVTKPQVTILDASIETKLSAHIIYNDVHFRNISDLKLFVSLLDREDRESCFIDPLIYRVGCLRMLGNTKIGKNNKLTVKRVINYTQTDKKTIFLDTLVTNINKNSRLINIEPFIKTSIATFKKTLPVKNITVPVENIINGIRNDEQYDVATLCISMLSKKRSDNYSDWIKIGICLYNIENTTRCFDLYHEFSKKSEKYTNEFECAYKWKSFMANNNALKKITIGTLKYMAKKDNPVEYEKNILSTKVDLKPFETIKFNQEYMVDLSKKITYQSTTITDWIKEEEIKKNIVCAKLLEWINSDTIKSFAIKSTYNTGKTALLSLLFEEYKLKFPKILLVSYRKSLTSDFIHNFSEHGFVSYESGHYNVLFIYNGYTF